MKSKVEKSMDDLRNCNRSMQQFMRQVVEKSETRRKFCKLQRDHCLN